MTTPFPTMEIGSLPKMPGREAKLKGRNPSDKDKEQLQHILHLVNDPPELTEIVEKFLQAEEKEQIISLNSLFNLRLLEAIGVHQVYDGEAQRKEMYQGVVEHVKGMQELDRQVSFVTKAGFPNTFVPYMYVHPLSIGQPLHDEEVKNIVLDAIYPVKVPITGAYTLGTWSDLGRFPQDLMPQGMKHSQARHKVMEELVYSFADKVINPTLKELAQQDIYRLQIDEPNASAFYGQEEILYEATRRSVAGVAGANGGRGGKEVELGIHICFSKDYGTIAVIARIPEIKFLTLEIANRDTPDHRAYREVIQAFESAGYQGKYCVGVLDVHTDELESPELIKERLLYTAELVGSQRIEAAPDCGLRSRTLTMAVQKLQRLVEGTRLAREQYQKI